ncbi:uncharacterized protein NPIL_137191 [Nephila pilipes]|uniref:Thyroglobulin type-1 domain-containing protein n=1 Tax=Nephila pilipes TaxID=299642 RepID=A0A8X6MRT9_NEPPI|nr:uncharacterized protein NPIL_137191 [Nephila pilipes]
MNSQIPTTVKNHVKVSPANAREIYDAGRYCNINTDMNLLPYILIVSFFCFVEILARSECETQRKKAFKEKQKWIPACTESGTFEEMQCHEGTTECFCVNSDGTRVTEPNTSLKTCKCHIHRYNKASRKLVGGYMPQCEEDGTYKKKQCHAGTGSCFCVDENGKRNNKTLDSCSPVEIKF